MSAEPTAIMAPAQALDLIQRHAERQADDICQLFEGDHDRAVLAMHLEEAASILQGDNGQPITNAQQEAALVALQGRAYKVEKAIETLRQIRVKPLQAEVKAINDLLGTASNPGGFVFGALVARMGKGGDADRRQAAYRAAERARIAREQEAAAQRQIEAARREEEALAAGRLAEASAAAEEQVRAELEAPRAQVRGVKTEDGKKTYHEEWTFEVVEASLVPREYLMVNEAAIRAAVKPKDGVRKIPGVSIYQAEVSRRGV